MKYTKKVLIELFNELEKELGRRPTKMDWINSEMTPSDMPIRKRFGNWNKFVKHMGLAELKPQISELAKVNKVKALRGKKGGNNKGGRVKTVHGYIDIWKPGHPNAKKNGYIAEHRMIMSDFLGRKLSDDEEVHHVNGIKTDNRIENLDLMTKSEHAKIHAKDENKQKRKESFNCDYPGCENQTSSKYKL